MTVSPATKFRDFAGRARDLSARTRLIAYLIATEANWKYATIGIHINVLARRADCELTDVWDAVHELESLGALTETGSVDIRSRKVYRLSAPPIERQPVAV